MVQDQNQRDLPAGPPRRHLAPPRLMNPADAPRPPWRSCPVGHRATRSRLCATLPLFTFPCWHTFTLRGGAAQQVIQSINTARARIARMVSAGGSRRRPLRAASVPPVAGSSRIWVVVSRPGPATVGHPVANANELHRRHKTSRSAMAKLAAPGPPGRRRAAMPGTWHPASRATQAPGCGCHRPMIG